MGSFYLTPMIYAAHALLTLANPTKTYTVKSASSLITEIDWRNNQVWGLEPIMAGHRLAVSTRRRAQ